MESADWQNLPEDLLEMLAKRTDIRLLRAVCSWWRSSLFDTSKKSLLFSTKIPLPMVTNEAHDPNNDPYFTLTERNIYCLQPRSDQNNFRMGWMVKLEETSSGKMKLFHTLSNSSQWPRSRNKLPSLLNLFDYRASCVGKEHKLTRTYPHNDIQRELRELDIKVQKVVVASLDHLAIMCIFGGRKLAHFKYGDENWTIIDDGLSETCDYSDVIHHKEKFYVIDRVGNVIVIDSSINVKVIAYPTHVDRGIQNGNPALVESNGDLFVVRKLYSLYNDSEGSNDDDYNVVDDYNYEDDDNNYEDDYNDYDEIMVSYKVCKFNSEKTEWVQVTNLFDQTFFIGDECCFSVSTTQFSGFAGNAIYFRASKFVLEDSDYPGSDVGIFQLDYGSARPLNFYHDSDHSIFWPFPMWFKFKQASKPSSSSYYSNSDLQRDLSDLGKELAKMFQFQVQTRTEQKIYYESILEQLRKLNRQRDGLGNTKE